MKTFRSRSGRVFWEAALLTTGLVVLLALVSQSLLAIHERDSRAGLREAALLAADTGLRYALARLGADPAWQAPGPLEVPPGEFGFSVREDRGTVQGSRVSSRGTPTRFRIRFHADGDPRAAVQDARGVLSRNHLQDGLSGPFDRSTAFLAILGEAGTGPEPEQRILRAWIRLVQAPPNASEDHPGLADWEGQSPVAWRDPGGSKWRTLENLDLGIGTRISRSPGGEPLILPTDEPGGARTASQTPLPEGAPILGGVYVWRVDSSGPYLEYYDRDPGLEALPPSGEGLRFENWPHAPGGEGFELDAEGLTVTLARDFVVRPSEEGFTGIAFRTDPVVSAMGGLPGLCFRPSSQRSRPVLFSAGPVRLDGVVQGIGGLVSSGSLTLQGPSILDSRPDSGVSLEARGDITLQPVPLEVAEPRQDFAHFVAARLLARQPLPTLAQYAEVRQEHSLARGRDPGKEPRFAFRPVWESDPGLAEAKSDQFRRILARFGSLNYSDQCLEASIRAGGAFNADLAGRGVLHLNGSLLTHAADGTPDAGDEDPSPVRRAVLRLERTVWSGPPRQVGEARAGNGLP